MKKKLRGKWTEIHEKLLLGHVFITSDPIRELFKNVEGQIKKINLHRRIAEVEVDFMNRKTVIHLGIEMVERKEEIN